MSLEEAARSLVVHFTGGTEVTIDIDAEPEQVFADLAEPGAGLVADSEGELHYLAKNQITYLTFGNKKGIDSRKEEKGEWRIRSPAYLVTALTRACWPRRVWPRPREWTRLAEAEAGADDGEVRHTAAPRC